MTGFARGDGAVDEEVIRDCESPCGTGIERCVDGQRRSPHALDDRNSARAATHWSLTPS